VRVGGDPLATAIALGGASRERADAFLKDQQHLVQLQAKELAHELDLRHWSMLVRHVSSVLKLALELAVGLVMLAVVAGLSLMVWNAAHSDGLIIESFSVPPDMAAKGFTGQVIAGKTLDELITIQNSYRTSRAAKSFTNNWGNDIKVEIPETGISVGEAFRFLKTWLGHETHISGEVTRTVSGLAITARVSGESGATVVGGEPDLDALVHKCAESIYRVTQPYRYGAYLQTAGRSAEAIAVFKLLAESGPEQERPWGYIGWANSLLDTKEGNDKDAPLQKALALQPDNILALNNFANGRSRTGQEEEEFHLNARQLIAFDHNPSATISPAQIPALRQRAEGIHAQLLGDWQEAARHILKSFGGASVYSASYLLSSDYAKNHNLHAAMAALADPIPPSNIAPGTNAFTVIQTSMELRSEAADWNRILGEARALDSVMSRYPGTRSGYLTRTIPVIAVAHAHLGNYSTAEALIAPTPSYCGPCLRARGWIAALRGQNTRADFWFARAAAAAPSIPFANAEWGKALLARGKPDDAIARFKLANLKGPHFADPLEGWGEALMAKNQSHLALPKFKQAEKYAPNWGRLHLKWGEALAYAGKKDEAKVQFARAAQLDLTPSEKAELRRIQS
jgi:tetratricopeptide (TPR) repeat protein